MKNTNMKPADIVRLAANKDVYIYSVNLEGLGYFRLFSKLGLSVKGFIDSRKYDGDRRMGAPVVHPDVFFAAGRDPASTFVLIASKHRVYKKVAAAKCEALGLKNGESFFFAMDLCDYLPTIELVGRCNLRCISCNMGLPDAPRGDLMAPETFRALLGKMTQDIPFMNSAALFLWGEPLLHPRLPEMVNIVHEHGIACEISTNLNVPRNRIEDLIKVGPDVLSVPCSGVETNYETTHTKGNWVLLRDNLLALRSYIDRHRVDTTVRIFYHMYKNNLDKDYDVVKGMARDLGYYFFPIIANIFPEKIFDMVVHKKPLPAEMQKASELLLFPIRDQLEYAFRNKDKFCPFRKAFPTVRWDLSVVSCANMSYPILAKNYLDVSLDELEKIRESASNCHACMSNGVHRFFDVVNVTVEDKDGKRVVTREMSR